MTRLPPGFSQFRVGSTALDGVVVKLAAALARRGAPVIRLFLTRRTKGPDEAEKILDTHPVYYGRSLPKKKLRNNGHQNERPLGCSQLIIPKICFSAISLFS